MTPKHSQLPVWASLASLVIAALVCPDSHAAGDRFWTLKPYRVRVLLAVETRGLASGEVAEHVARRVTERADASIGPIWDLAVTPLAGDARLAALHGLSDEELLELAQDEDNPIDKLFVVTLRESPAGVTAEGVEIDPLLQHIGPRRSAPPCELPASAESAFALMHALFSPVAVFDVDRKTDDSVTLSFRGSGLPQREGAGVAPTPGAVMLPILRRTNREGELVEGGVKQAPWTFFQVSDRPVGEGLVHGQIHSHARRPFGVRRGRVEQYALLLHASDEPTTIRLHVRDQPETPLSGYRVFLKDGDADAELLATSNADGKVMVEPGKSAIRMAYIKSGAQVVAKTPVPAGAIDQIEVPLLDERTRLEAEARLSLLNEELLDLVARRTILAARIDDLIGKGKRKEATELLDTLDGMPGRSQFSQKLARVKQQYKSDEPVVQARIEKLFKDTNAVLGAFLGTEQVRELRAKLSAAP